MSKNKVKIVIDEKPFILMGEESEEHIRQVADYINIKIKEVKAISPHIAANVRMTHVLTSINVADDFFKEREKNAVLTKQLADTERKRALEETRNKQMKELKKLLETARNAIVEYQNKLKKQETLLSEAQEREKILSETTQQYKTTIEALEAEKEELTKRWNQFESTEIQLGTELKDRLKQCEEALQNTRRQWNETKEA